MRISDWSSDVCSADRCIKGTIPRSRLFGRTGKRWIALPGITRQADEQRRSNEFPCRAGYPAEADDSGARQDRQRNGDDPAVHCPRSEEHTSELQSLMRISYAVFCLKKKTTDPSTTRTR